jgi:hypothetical protein
VAAPLDGHVRGEVGKAEGDFHARHSRHHRGIALRQELSSGSQHAISPCLHLQLIINLQWHCKWELPSTVFIIACIIACRPDCLCCWQLCDSAEKCDCLFLTLVWLALCCLSSHAPSPYDLSSCATTRLVAVGQTWRSHAQQRVKSRGSSLTAMR